MTEKPDYSGGYCCVAAGMHMGHDEDCPAKMRPDVRSPALRRSGEDLGESLVDIGLCERAIEVGVRPEQVTTDPAERRTKNEGFVRVISEELKRRGRDLEGPFPLPAEVKP